VASATGGHAGRTAAGSLDELSPFGLRDWIWLDETPWDSLYCNIMYKKYNLYINYIYSDIDIYIYCIYIIWLCIKYQIKSNTGSVK
jgi:hypothetical protein